MTEPTDDLQQRCAEVAEWQRTGVLPGNALLNYAEAHWSGRHDSLQMAERDTSAKAMQWIAKWGTPPVVAGEPVAVVRYTETRAVVDWYGLTPPSGAQLYTTPQPTQAQAGAVPLTDERIDAVAESMPGGLDGFLKSWGWRQFAREILTLRRMPDWEPQFDCMAPNQEELALQFCQEIAGQRGKRGSPPDPVRLLEMAEALYKAEREASHGIKGGQHG